MKITKLILLGLCVVLPDLVQAEPSKSKTESTKSKKKSTKVHQQQTQVETEKIKDQAEQSDIQKESTNGSIILLDQIECVVCGPERNTPFPESLASWKKDLNGNHTDLQKQIQQEIVSQQVISEKMPMDPAAAQKYIEGLKTQNNLTDADLVAMFAEVGRTTEEGLALLHDQYVQEFFTHYKFKSQLVATDDEINEYYNEYPEFIEGWVEVQVAHIPYDTSSEKSVKKQLEKFIAKGLSLIHI